MGPQAPAICVGHTGLRACAASQRGAPAGPGTTSGLVNRALVSLDLCPAPRTLWVRKHQPAASATLGCAPALPRSGARSQVPESLPALRTELWSHLTSALRSLDWLSAAQAARRRVRSRKGLPGASQPRSPRPPVRAQLSTLEYVRGLERIQALARHPVPGLGLTRPRLCALHTVSPQAPDQLRRPHWSSSPRCFTAGLTHRSWSHIRPRKPGSGLT